MNAHDFPSLGDGKAVPYGIYDVGRNEGFVSAGVTKDTAEYLDKRTYKKGREVTEREMKSLRIERAAFHGEWNYTILPKVNA